MEQKTIAVLTSGGDAPGMREGSEDHAHTRTLRGGRAVLL